MFGEPRASYATQHNLSKPPLRAAPHRVLPNRSVDFSTDDPGPLPADPGAAASNGEIGGGGAAASNDSSGEPAWTRFQEQASLLRARVPGLFDPSRGVRLMTEVRQWQVQAAVLNGGWLLARPPRVCGSPAALNPARIAPHTHTNAERAVAAGQGGLHRQPCGVHKALGRQA